MHRLLDVFLEFFRLGLTSFGGPSAHIAYFRDRFVSTKKWLTESEFAAMLALTQFLPGPGSSQLGMSIGWKMGGVAGSVAAFLGFTLPSAVAMILFAIGVMQFGDLDAGRVGWIRGLQIAVVAVIANAVWSMAKSLCQGRTLSLIGVISAAAAVGIVSPWTQIGVIVAGALAGWFFLRLPGGRTKEKSTDPSETEGVTSARRGSPVPSAICLLLFFLLLGALPWLTRSEHPLIDAFAAMYQSGALVFGGGHVVLPLLSREVVDPGLIGAAQFSAGYGAAQAVPGPLFTISSYLGALLEAPGGPWLPALVCTLGIFLPGWLLVLGTLPFWERLKDITDLRNALAGTNAAVVGLLGAALYDPVWTKAVRGPLDVVFLLGVAALLLILKLPPWLVVIISGVSAAFVF